MLVTSETMLPATFVITMTGRACARVRAQLHGLAESVGCIDATRLRDVTTTQYPPLEDHNASLLSGAVVRLRPTRHNRDFCLWDELR